MLPAHLLQADSCLAPLVIMTLYASIGCLDPGLLDSVFHAGPTPYAAHVPVLVVPEALNPPEGGTHIKRVAFCSPSHHQRGPKSLV